MRRLGKALFATLATGLIVAAVLVDWVWQTWRERQERRGGGGR